MRGLVRAFLTAVSLAACASAALAQATYPSRPVRLLVPFAAGAGTDVIARTITQRAGELLGQPIVVENRPGAAGNLGAGQLVSAAPDGYTIGILSTIHAVNQSLFRTPGFELTVDFAPVIEVGISPTVWAVRADLPARSVAELVQLARSKPGSLTYGSGGATAPAELFKALTGTDITIVPYKGVSAVMTDLLAGRVDMTVAGFLDTNAHLKSGKLRALAVTTTTRLPQLPDVPAMAESLPGYEFTLWYGIFAPRGTPPAAVAALRTAFAGALEAPEVLARFESLAVRPSTSTPEAFAARVRGEVERWADTIKKAGIARQD